jgi:hypothetical protein
VTSAYLPSGSGEFPVGSSNLEVDTIDLATFSQKLRVMVGECRSSNGYVLRGVRDKAVFASCLSKAKSTAPERSA